MLPMQYYDANPTAGAGTWVIPPNDCTTRFTAVRLSCGLQDMDTANFTGYDFVLKEKKVKIPWPMVMDMKV